ncbi:RNA polymerase sigma factor [Agaricicola taiwanensis]|uniref:RNA polymerase sigma factor n=1 Tax=Agaricicola taiwanensis TaxID=591372 RepID=A0A8J3DZ36_9RHOB|nr:sigma-70 family RNA polymerase sigma factor [Agaricicola taiwanensis]GGE50613.1 RNA polymerase sigma factor [Agaricicola taiwanensis]
MSNPAAVREAMLAEIQSLRAFAVSLCGQVDRADDLVQETLMKAWLNLDRFQEGTNMRAWLFTILRNVFYSEHRKRRREVEDSDGSIVGRLAVHPGQDGHMDMQDFREALSTLPPDQREALVLVGASGFSYEEAAEICDCAVGTIKSRVNRARNALSRVLAVEGREYGPEADTHAALGKSITPSP